MKKIAWGVTGYFFFLLMFICVYESLYVEANKQKLPFLSGVILKASCLSLW